MADVLMTVVGRLVILEPWVPDSQVQHSVTVGGRGLQNPQVLILISDTPMYWGEVPATVVAFVKNRYADSPWVDTTTKVMVNGALWIPRDSGINSSFVGELDLEDTIPGPST